MRVKVKVIDGEMGPSEKLIGVETIGGTVEQVIVSQRIIRESAIEVGLGLAFEGDKVLIELPRESTSGKWRIWIPKDSIHQLDLQAAE